jgi:hypothetical protein
MMVRMPGKSNPTAGRNVSWYNHCGKQHGGFFKKTKIDL